MSKLLLTAAFVFSAQMALALTTDELAATYQTQGYTHISIKSGLTQIKVEAIKDGQKIEVIYDKATGETLKSETHKIGTVGSADPGVRLREVGRDFIEADDGDDEDGDDDGDNDDDGHDDEDGDDDGENDDDGHDDEDGDDDGHDDEDGDDEDGDDDGDDENGDDHDADEAAVNCDDSGDDDSSNA